MSKLGKKLILLDKNVEIEDRGDYFEVKGPLGVLKIQKPKNFDELFSLVKENNSLKIVAKKEKLKSKEKSLWGLARVLLNNAIIGVTQGWKKEIILEGLGYNVELKNNKLIFKVGKSHLVEFEPPSDIKIDIKSERGKITLTLSGIDKQKLGQVGSAIISIKRRDIYKGKGFRWADEILKLKPVKKAIGS